MKTGRKLISAMALAVGIALALGGMASAQPFGPEENLAYAIAIEYWGRAPDQCSEITETVEPLVGEGGHATQPAPGQAPAPCVLAIDSNTSALTFDLLCPVMVHEVGHLLGYGHSENPGDVLYVGGLPSFLSIPGCARESERRGLIPLLDRTRRACPRYGPNSRPRCWREARDLRERIKQLSAQLPSTAI